MTLIPLDCSPGHYRPPTPFLSNHLRHSNALLFMLTPIHSFDMISQAQKIVDPTTAVLVLHLIAGQ